MTYPSKRFWITFAIVAIAVVGALFVYQKRAGIEPVAALITGEGVDASQAAVATTTAEVEAPVIEGAPPMPGVVAGTSVGGAFALTDHKGNPVTEKSWSGKYKLVFFGFTHCPDICPAAIQKISTALDQADAKGEKIAPLFITVDPERDTPAVLASYLAPFNSSIIGLTGTTEQLKTVQDGYKVYAAKADGTDPESYNMDHSAYIFLMSPEDQLLEIFDTQVTAEEMAKKIKLRAL